MNKIFKLNRANQQFVNKTMYIFDKEEKTVEKIYNEKCKHAQEIMEELQVDNLYDALIKACNREDKTDNYKTRIINRIISYFQTNATRSTIKHLKDSIIG